VGQGTTVLALVGPSGSGRSRLARLGSPGLLEVRCHRGLAHRAYGSLAEAVPGLRPGADPVPVVDAVRRHAAGAAAVLLADLDRADPATIDALELLADQLPLVVTVDPAGPEALRAMRAVAAAGATVVEVPRLSAEEAAELVAALDPGLGPGRVGRIVAAGAGLPVALELLVALPPASSLAGAVATHVAGLDAPTACSALSLALLQKPVRVEHLPGIDALVEAGLAARDGATRAVVRHPLVAAALAAAFPESDHRDLYARMGPGLAAADPGAAARHALAAGDRARAATHALAAADAAAEPAERALHLEVLAAATGDPADRVAAAAALVAAGYAERAEALAGPLAGTDGDTGASAAVVLARVDAARGDTDAAAARLLAAGDHHAVRLELARDARAAARAAYTAHAYHGDLRQAIELADAQADVARRRGSRTRELQWRTWAANLRVTGLGDYGEALDELLRLGAEPLAAADRVHLDACTIVALSDVGREIDWRRLLRDRWGGRPARPLLRWAVASAEANASRWSTVLATVEQGRGTGGAVEPLVEVLERWALLLLGQPVPPPVDDRGVPNLSAVVPESRALAAWSAGDLAAAEARFAEAAVLWTRTMWRNSLRARLGQAECRRRLGDVGGAVELFQGVGADAADRGLVVMQRRAEDGLRRCGAAPPASRPVAALTAREHAVLLRVAAGASSVDIAADLLVTARTVDKTVARAMRKLGARTRHQAAGMVAGTRGRDADVELTDDTLALLRRLAAGDTVSTAAVNAGMSRRTATRRLAGLRAELGVASTAAVLDALAARL